MIYTPKERLKEKKSKKLRQFNKENSSKENKHKNIVINQYSTQIQFITNIISTFYMKAKNYITPKSYNYTRFFRVHNI